MKIQSFILCDDVREEVGRKFTLAGVYDHTIQIGLPNNVEVKWPIGMNLGFMLRAVLESDELNCNTLDIQFFHNEALVAKLPVAVKFTDNKKPFSVHAKLPNFPIIGSGLLNFKFTLRDGNKVIRDVSSDYSIEITVQKGLPNQAGVSPNSP